MDTPKTTGKVIDPVNFTPLTVQGILPKEFALPSDMSLTDKFKTTGNGVPYLMAKGIATTIRDYLNELAK